MKTAIYIDDGVTQLVLTPQNEWEKNSLKNIPCGEGKVTVHRGSFYPCEGGWIRQGESDESLILVTAADAKPEVEC